MLVLGELEVKRKCALVRSSGQTVPVSLAAVPHCYSVSHHYGQFSNRVGRRGASARAIRAGAAHGGDVDAKPVGIGPSPRMLARAAAMDARCAVQILLSDLAQGFGRGIHIWRTWGRGAHLGCVGV